MKENKIEYVESLELHIGTYNVKCDNCGCSKMLGWKLGSKTTIICPNCLKELERKENQIFHKKVTINAPDVVLRDFTGLENKKGGK